MLVRSGFSQARGERGEGPSSSNPRGVDTSRPSDTARELQRTWLRPPIPPGQVRTGWLDGAEKSLAALWKDVTGIDDDIEDRRVALMLQLQPLGADVKEAGHCAGLGAGHVCVRKQQNVCAPVLAKGAGVTCRHVNVNPWAS